MVALYEIAKLGDDVGGRSGLVDEFGVDPRAAEPDLIIGCWHFAGVETVDQEFGSVVIRYAERRSGRSGEEGHEADLNGRRVFFGVQAGGRKERQAEGQTGRENKRRGIRLMAHGRPL